jgi:hypothetical protein
LLAQEGAPDGLGLGVLLQAQADVGELVPAARAAQAIDHAGEVLAVLGAEQAQQRGAGAVQVAQLLAQDGFEEEQLICSWMR